MQDNMDVWYVKLLLMAQSGACAVRAVRVSYHSKVFDHRLRYCFMFVSTLNDTTMSSKDVGYVCQTLWKHLTERRVLCSGVSLLRLAAVAAHVLKYFQLSHLKVCFLMQIAASLNLLICDQPFQEAPNEFLGSNETSLEISLDRRVSHIVSAI